MTLLVGIDHVQIGMPAGGEETARAFYGGVLGLTEVAKPPQLAGRGGVWFVAEGIALHLGVEADFHAAARAHTAFVVEDLDALRQRLAGSGVTPIEDDSGLPVRRCYVHDPFGNRIELVDVNDAGFTGPT